MKTIYGILLVGVSVIALGGCSTSEKGAAAAFANALLGSGAFEGGDAITVSAAADDERTTATVVANDDDTVTVTVANGGTVAGPRDYKLDAEGVTGIGNDGVYDNAIFNVLRPDDDGADSILIAAVGQDSFTGFVGSFGAETSNIAAGFGGTAPTGTRPASPVTYEGTAAGVKQEVGAALVFLGGDATVNADFTDGSVDGTFNLNRNSVGGSAGADAVLIAFEGNMTGDKVNYESTAVSYDSVGATGQVIGGFFGTNYDETVGAFDVQAAGGAKVTGSFGADLQPE